jgi:hypothetical protein
MKRLLPILNTIFLIGILLSSYFLYTGIAPIVDGMVRVEMQDEDDIEWNVVDKTIFADTYVNIINGGKYDITDIGISIWIRENVSGYVVYRFNDTIPRVRTGTVYHEPINISVDLNTLPKEMKNRLIGNYTNFTVRGEIIAYSIEGMGEIKVHYHNIFEWEPLIKAMEVDTNSTRINYSSEELTISVPYHISTSSLLSGFANASITIYNGTVDDEHTLSSLLTRIPLGEDHNGTLDFVIDKNDTYYLMTHSRTLPVFAEVTKNAFTFNYSTEYQWGAPFDNLHIGKLNKTLNSAYVDYSFTNNYKRYLDLSIDIHVYDSSGNLVGQSSDHYIAQRGSYVKRTASVSVTGVPSYAIVKVTENESGWSYEFRREV